MEEAVVLGMMERSCSSPLSIHTGWVMLGHLLAEIVFQDVFCGLSLLNKEFTFLLLWCCWPGLSYRPGAAGQDISTGEVNVHVSLSK